MSSAFDNVVTGIGTFFTNLGQGIADGFTSIVKWFSDLFTGLGDWFGDVIDGIGSVFSWLGNFFVDLLEFVYHIFIPTDEQWDAIKQDYQDLGDTFTNHLPFVSLFSDELENAKQIVYNEDFLNIKFDSWSFDLGVVQFSTPEINFTSVLDAYEPYRMTIRTLLTFVVVCLTLVYIIKYFLNYGETGGNTNVIDNGNGGGNK